MLAQVIATINVEGWQALGAIFVIVAGQVFRFFQEWIKDRRERDAETQRLDVLRAMLGNLEHLNQQTEKQNGKLETVIEVDRAHHSELLSALTAACRVMPKGGKEWKTPLPP